MTYRVIISAYAKDNIKDAVAYYKNKVSAKVAAEFIKDYELALKKIKQTPHFQVYYKNFRGLPLKRYPYIIFYRVDEKNKLILINGVFQANQNTDKRPS